jgi:hypothetical protein
LRFHLDSVRSPPRGALESETRPAWWKAGGAIAVAYEFHLESLWLMLVIPALGFMLWVLWNLHKETKR